MTEVLLSFGDIDRQTQERYEAFDFGRVLETVMAFITQKMTCGLALPYYPKISAEQWQSLNKELGIYITEETQGRQLNLDARGKDYATNILSYPSDLPSDIVLALPALPLGELVICHQVLTHECSTQHKEFLVHLTHLTVHGILHLLGFDHELGDMQADEMEGFEIAILADLGMDNPYDIS